jgi:hypothetical protein
MDRDVGSPSKCDLIRKSIIIDEIEIFKFEAIPIPQSTFTFGGKLQIGKSSAKIEISTKYIKFWCFSGLSRSWKGIFHSMRSHFELAYLSFVLFCFVLIWFVLFWANRILDQRNLSEIYFLKHSIHEARQPAKHFQQFIQFIQFKQFEQFLQYLKFRSFLENIFKEYFSINPLKYIQRLSCGVFVNFSVEKRREVNNRI